MTPSKTSLYKLFYAAGLVGLAVFVWSFFPSQNSKYKVDPNLFVSHIVDPQDEALEFFWKDEQGQNFRNFKALHSWLNKRNKELIFAMNGGMYMKDLRPQGLYVEHGKTMAPVNRRENAYGNFYMQPNGIFYLDTNNRAAVVTTKAWEGDMGALFATQSGPMLLIDSTIHHQFKKGSANLHIRNGVGILPDGRVLFAMSKQKVNFYDFATFFMNNGCRNALYLDGFVSRTYLPEQKWIQLDGNFGVIIGETRMKPRKN